MTMVRCSPSLVVSLCKASSRISAMRRCKRASLVFALARLDEPIFFRDNARESRLTTKFYTPC
jgi:hypothetical protein